MTVKMRNEITHLQLPRPIAIVGLGISGDATLRLLLKSGIPRKDILTFDQKSLADFNDPQQLLEVNPQTLCVSPGVPLSTPWIQETLKAGARLTSELEIAFSFITTEKIVATTGSVGKSTTTALMGYGAKTADPHSFCGGNLGTPLAQYACDLIDGKTPAQFVLLELSSYQLENFTNLKADLSVFTFLSPNHLERYSSLQQYYDTKLTLLHRTRRWVIVNKNGGDNLSQFQAIQKKYSSLEFSYVDRNSLPSNANPQLVGAHNLDNLAMAFAVAEKLRWPPASYQAMLSFAGLSHRMENVGRFNSVLFINDSKATTMDSVLQAFQSVAGECIGKVHLLLGGRDKNLPWHQLKPLAQEKNLSVTFFGECANTAKEQSQISGSVFPKLGEALSHLSQNIHANDIVLFSPGGTSLDEFKNFEDRGNYFKNWVLSKFKN